MPSSIPPNVPIPRVAELSAIRHDLRTPINHIIGYTELMLEENEDTTPESVHEDLSHILAGGRELLSLVNDYFKDEKFNANRIREDSTLLKLRTSVTQVIGYCDLLFEKTEDTVGFDSLSDLKRVHAAATHWLEMMESTLFLLANGKLTIQTGRTPVCSTRNTAAQKTLHRQFTAKGRILVVDDDANNRDVLAKRLIRAGHNVTTVSTAYEAFQTLDDGDFDVILLDMIMPEMNGDVALAQIKKNKKLKHLPVIMISGLDQMDGIVRCIEIGADDYLPKPFNYTLLQARINAALEKKHLRDQETLYLEEIQTAQARSENLLLNILPSAIANRLKSGETLIADNCDSVSVVFTDFVGFTAYSKKTNPKELVSWLNNIFTKFDEAAEEFGLEKIKTIGDAYMAVAGLPQPRNDHAHCAILFGKKILQCLAKVRQQTGVNLNMRIGIHSGPVTAGIIGKNKFIYDIWGDTVNIASRMESQGKPGRIQITEATASLLNNEFPLEEQLKLSIKGHGEMATYLAVQN